MRNRIPALLLLGITTASGSLAPGRSWAHAPGASQAPARIAPHRYAIVVETPPGRPCVHRVKERFMAIAGVDAVSVDTATMTITVTMRPGASLERATAANAARKVGLVMRDFRSLAQGPNP